ncbi:hypothetical protein TanjilG_28241 [Lupinus angustifolius]|uniref:Mediator of RNA polymerase II transcription subunit 4 n=1 Tax=Lupinus angustifolius TaxID=3871 RepID=A0A4P1REU2_LUPAN|nr:PREDICTED: mediator of RNA polymerase II transcription subunit 4 [Lupinus angustifolius]XP_019446883.1 PREDICTED: mediator of RNA polymerase II transcription subunit 4 [Lupinus angustifolius]XP_019446884.1 PREDICTED: mediator of RNA polymerase II transcription subunit 4 [Lupinus angustifolius]OIW09642.1 hypothetical protein TanjilG_28241 [Lupinus angustifolius]
MLQHQVVQSPARLGLTNPNSPSIPNPTPPKLPPSQTHHNQPHQDRHSTTPSSALLSLLPPLPRAQALLQQMASLASKLFEVSSNRSLWITAFRGSLPTFLSSQGQAHFSTQLETSPSSTKEILSLFTVFQTQIFEAVAELQEILDLQDAKQKIDHEIRSKDSALLAFANKLKDAERGLDILVDDYSDYRRTKRTKSDGSEDDSLISSTISSQLKLADILSYAHRISYTTFAPPEFGAGLAPLRGALPPAPQDEQMRASQLYHFADLDIGLPKVETKEKTIEAIIVPPPPQPVDKNPLADLSSIQGLLPPNFMVPPGWKPGMPVQLPMDIPIKPPPGWKPGDPVPLPPVDSLPVPRFEELPHPQIPQPKQPEVIQVQHVNLDLGGTDSSDYSSDDASTDDED